MFTQVKLNKTTMEKEIKEKENVGLYFSRYHIILALILITLQTACIIYLASQIQVKSGQNSSPEDAFEKNNVSTNARLQRIIPVKVLNEDYVKNALEKAKIARKIINSSTEFVIDIYKPGHSISNPELCSGEVKIMICVMSKSQDFERRTAIRMTWGSYRVKYNTVSIGFFVGSTNDSEINLNLEIEDETHGDIIKNNIVDNEYNLTLKTISMFEWIQTSCPTIERIVKVEDDVFINIPQLIEYISLSSYENRMIFGRIETKPVETKEFHKSIYGVYAPKLNQRYTTGPCYVVTKDSIKDLFENSLLEPYMSKEDLFITGILADRINLTRIHSPKFFNSDVGPRPCYALKGMSVAYVKPEDQFTIWKRIFSEKAECESPIKYITKEEKSKIIEAFDKLFGIPKRAKRQVECRK